MTQKHKRPSAPASKKLPKKAAKPAVAAHSSKEKAAHAAAHSKDKGKHVEKHVEVKKPLVKGKAPEKVVAPVADTKGKVVELKAAQKLAAARAAAAAVPAPVEGKKGKKGNAELINLPARRNVLPEERQSQLKLLIARGKEQGYLTYSQVNDHLPSEIVDPEQIEEIVNTINDMGIPVYEKAPDNESILAPEPSAPTDEEAIEEAAAALAALDAELGRTTDPVRMYMREMGTVELLTREGEIRIAKRIEEGLDAVRLALSNYPSTAEYLLKAYEPVKTGGARLVDIIVGFIDPNAPDVIAQPQNPTKMDLTAPVVEEKPEGEETEEGDGTGEEEEAVDTGPDPEEAARRFAAVGKYLANSLEPHREDGREGSEDPEGPQEALRRVHGAQARAAHVRGADRQPAQPGQRDPPARKGNHDHCRARRRHAAQGIHPLVPEERDEQPLAAEAGQGRQEVVERARPPAGRNLAPPGQAVARSRRNITSRSRTSKRSTVKCRSAKRKPAARRRRWSRPTCAS